MIVPLIRIASDSPTEQLEWISEIQRFGLLGRVAIEFSDSIALESAEKLIVATGGKYELQILMEKFESDVAIALLNAGANQIVTMNQVESGPVPKDRVTQAKGVWRESHPPPDWNDISNDWKAPLDHLVELAVLQTPEKLADVLIEQLISDRPDGLWATVIVDRLGVALGLAYSNAESLRKAFADGVGVYFSRSRNQLWVKGQTSGAVQKLVGVRVDCDFDTLRFQVEQQAPGFCHKNTHTCFGYERNISEVIERLESRVSGADEKSFTKKLFDDPEMLRKKLLEEAQELSEAESSSDTAWEAADVLYFSLIAMMRKGATLSDVYEELARRTQRVVRRKNKLEI